MNGIIEAENKSEIIERRSAVDVASGARWADNEDRVGSCPGRSAMLRAQHLAQSADAPAPASPRLRRAPRESRRVSLAQASGYVQLNQYRLLEPIGQGSYGIVKLAYNEEDDTHYAMKILSKRKLMRRAGLFGRAPPRMQGPGPPPDPLQRVYREIAVLKKLDHPNVVKLVEVLDDPAEDQLYLVFQLLEGGPVIEIPTDNPLSEEVARKYFRDVLLGVEYLHYQGIAHRDLKPANLLLGEGRVQVADLGACGELAARLSGAVGTPAFRAPEATASTDNYAGEAADMWSLGVTLYALVSGRVPWGGRSAPELCRRVQAEPLCVPRRVSPALRRLLARLLHKDPAQRITLQDTKAHEWVTAGGREPLPSEQENCRLVEVTEEDMARVVTSIPNLSTLILIKTMLKKHSFQNPFLRSREGSAARRESVSARGEGSGGAAGAGGGGEPAGGRRGGQLARAGRSLSAPGNYMTERQASFDVGLESVQEGQSQDIPAGNTNADSPCDSCQSDSNSAKCQNVSADVNSASCSQSVSRSQSVSDNQTNSDGSTLSSQKNNSPGSGQCVNNSHSFRITQSSDNSVVNKSVNQSVSSLSVTHVDSSSKQTTNCHSVSSQINKQHASCHGISSRDVSNQNVSNKNDSAQGDSNQKVSCHSINKQNDSSQSVSHQKVSCQGISDQKVSCQSSSDQKVSCQSISNQNDTTQSVSDQKVSIQNINKQNDSSQSVSHQKVSCQSISDQKVSCQSISDQKVSCQNISKQNDSSQNDSSQSPSSQNVSESSQRKSSQEMKER